MKPHRIFFDTEFTGLGIQNPQLISIGLIDQSGTGEFYAEVQLTQELRAGCHSWVRQHVLPHLEGGVAAMPKVEISRRLYDWLCALAPNRHLVLISDSPIVDAPYVHELLRETGYPPNMDRHIRPMKMPSPAGWQRYHSALERAQKAAAYREHHALDDARANRAAWIAGHRNDALAASDGSTFPP
jgi:hypothetical protein